MISIITEGVEYSCLDIEFIGEKDDTPWFMVFEDAHPMYGTKFGLRSFDHIGDTVEFDIIAEKHINIEALQPIVNDFVIVIMGECLENQSTE